MELSLRLQESADVIRKIIKDFVPEIGVILGSGWGPVADCVENPVKIPYAQVPFMKVSTATGHVGQFVFGMLGGKRVCVMQGRIHGYEGNSAQEVAYPVWLMHELGIHTLITANAAGAINESFHVGQYCLMNDMINFMGRNPLDSVEADKLSFRFVSLKDAFDPALRVIAHESADACGADLQEGVYLGMLGPSFETPAEIRMFRAWGADSVAMSVIEEVVAARHVGVKVVGVSLLTNMACGINDSNPSDEEVLEIAHKLESVSKEFICTLVEKLPGK